MRWLCKVFGHDWKVVQFWPGLAFSTTHIRVRECHRCHAELSDIVTS